MENKSFLDESQVRPSKERERELDRGSERAIKSSRSVKYI